MVELGGKSSTSVSTHGQKDQRKKKRRDEEKKANQESQLLKKWKKRKKIKRQKAKKGQIWYPGIQLYLAYVPLRS